MCAQRIVLPQVLIETLWNVKKSKPKTNNILTDVLIETLWNVKIISPWIIYFASRVLIETLWNVKQVLSKTLFFGSLVLIETLWNVKYCEGLMIVSFSRINRNIVECKVIFNQKSGYHAEY